MGAGANLAFILIASTGEPEAPNPHLAEIKLFASTVALARTAHDECSGFTINEGLLEGLRQRLRVAEPDYPAYLMAARAAADALHRALSEAPSKAAWCDAAVRLYGPSGTLVPGLVRRELPKP